MPFRQGKPEGTVYLRFELTPEDRDLVRRAAALAGDRYITAFASRTVVAAALAELESRGLDREGRPVGGAGR